MLLPLADLAVEEASILVAAVKLAAIIRVALQAVQA
jgi:hypothetical protein